MTVFQRDWLSSNNVLLMNHDQTVLIDSGYSSHTDMTSQLLIHALKSRSLDVLVNTHLHSDHCGGNAHLQTLYPAVQTFIPPGQIDAVADWREDQLTYVITGQNCPRFAVTSALCDRCEYEWAGLRWLALSAPGHDNHAMMFYCSQHGILISGDALWEKGFGVIFPELDEQSGYEEASQTFDLISDLKPALVIPGHGNMFTDTQSALSYARSRLDAFRNHPDKHARYASKVLVKFKLQEHGHIPLHSFRLWAQSVPYLMRLHQQLQGDLPFAAWFDQLLADMCQSGVMDIQGEELFNMP